MSGNNKCWFDGEGGCPYGGFSHFTDPSVENCCFGDCYRMDEGILTGFLKKYFTLLDEETVGQIINLQERSLQVNEELFRRLSKTHQDSLEFFDKFKKNKEEEDQIKARSYDLAEEFAKIKNRVL